MIFLLQRGKLRLLNSKMLKHVLIMKQSMKEFMELVFMKMLLQRAFLLRIL